MGVISILSYLFVGAAMRHLFTKELLQKLAALLAFSIIFIAGIKLFAYNIFDFNGSVFFNWSGPLHGFIADRNAFTFMAALSVVLLIFSFSPSASENRTYSYVAVLMSLLVTLMILSGSRSGFGAATIIIIWMVLFLPRHIPVMIFGAGSMFFMIELSNLVSQHPVPLFHERLTNNLFDVSGERILLFSDGYKMFLSHPLFGGGLGASIEKNGLVIHNLYLWILGEMGLVGVMLSLPLAIAFFRTGWRMISSSTSAWSQNKDIQACVIFIMICGGYSLVQDIAYQRILWLLIGFIMAKQMTIFPVMSDRRPKK